MSEQLNAGQLLSGIGAAIGGRGQQYIQNIKQEQRTEEDRSMAMSDRKRQEMEYRQKAMYEDGYNLFTMMGDIENTADDNLVGMMSLLDDRMEMLSALPDADPKDTLAVRDLVQRSMDGDPTAYQPLVQMLTGAASTYQNMYMRDNRVDDPSSVREYKFVNGLSPEDQQRFLAIQRSQTYQNLGDRIISPNQLNPSGEPTASYEVNLAPGERPETRGAQAAATANAEIAAIPERSSAEGAAARVQDVISLGLAGAQGIPVLRRSLDLIDSVKTGGIDAFRFRAKQMFGVEHPDEGELSALLGRAVLSQLRETFGAAFTEKEGARLENISARMGSNQETNRRLLQSTLAIVERASNRAIDAAEKAGDFDTADEIRSLLEFDMMTDDPLDNGGGLPADAEANGVTQSEWDQMTEADREIFR